MHRDRLNYWIDVGLLVSFIIVAVSGLVIAFAFVSGSPGEGRDITFLGTDKADWLPWHGYSGLVMIALVLVHLALHFEWLVCMTKSLFEEEEVVEEPEASEKKV
jgi:cytochrome b subunit of formate dehydrogenase